MKGVKIIIAFLCCMILLAGCGKEESKKQDEKAKPLVIDKQADKESTEDKHKKDRKDHTEENTKEVSEVKEASDGQEQGTEPPAEESGVQSNGHVIAVDAGHQAVGNPEQEPIGPGASEMKAKVASGTSGTATGVNEYELTLAVSQKLRQELENRGYTVVMIRDSNEVDISNAQRAQTANHSGAEAFIRVHANGSESAASQGALTMCMTSGNPYNGNLYDQSRKLSDLVLDGLCSASGASKNSVIETDTMSGINWCTIPVTIVEMGFMTNPEEDVLMEDENYQRQMAKGIVDGLDAYFAG